MSKEQIDFQGALRLVELIKASANFSEIRMRVGDIEIELRRHGATDLPATAGGQTIESAAGGPLAVPAEGPSQRPSNGPAGQTSTSIAKTRPIKREGATIIHSPMVGTIYHAPEPGATPFVELGQKVSPDDQVCIVEVMKLMNSIDAGCHGVVTEILVRDGEAVEYGQELFVISTS